MLFLSVEQLERMSASQLRAQMFAHADRKAHAGKEKHAQLEVLMDHAERAPSLLHHRTSNSCASSILVTLCDKATPAIRKPMNVVLKAHGQHWSFATSKSQRDSHAA
eukprot:5266187-Pleurochrysis_carterae.AAC.1